ncbi:MAG: PEGA domain-containing protein [Nannocystaceae bacterium]|nr:PEGA domain-containing protein [Nannocystaceae bacterium]
MPMTTPAPAAAAPVAEAIPRKRTILGMPAQESGRPAGPPASGDVVARRAPAVVVPPAESPTPGVPEATVRAGSGRVIGSRVRRNRVPTIGTAVLKASATKRRVDGGPSPLTVEAANDARTNDARTNDALANGVGVDADTNRVAKDAARRMAETPAPPELRAPKGRTLSPREELHEAPRGRTVAMDAAEVKRAAVAGSGRAKASESATLGLDLIAEDSAAAAALMASTPIVEQPSPTRFGALIVVGGLIALALGGLTAWLALDDDGERDAGSDVALANVAPKTDPVAVGGDAGAQADKQTDKQTDKDEPAPPDEPRVINVAAPDTSPAAEADSQPVPDGPASSGTLLVNAASSAHVLIDGKDMGIGPYSGQLAVGSHQVRVTTPGYQPWDSTVEVQADERVSVTPTLRRRKGGGRKHHNGGRADPVPVPDSQPPKTDPPKADTPKADPPKADPPPKKDDVFMNTDTGKPSGGIFLPVGKGK